MYIQKGFTLIELMIVVSIIGILTAVAIPAYQTYTTRAQVSESLFIVGELKSSIAEYYKHKGSFPADNVSAGIPEAKYLLGNYVKGITLDDGAFHITLGNKVNENLEGKVLTVRPIVVTGSPASPFSWVCGSGAVPEGMEAVGQNLTNIDNSFLPAMCRF